MDRQLAKRGPCFLRKAMVAALVLLCAALWASAEPAGSVQKVCSIHITGMDQIWLCDALGDNLLLLGEPRKSPSLIVYDFVKRQIVHRIPIDPAVYAFKPFGFTRRFGRGMNFRFVDGGERIIGMLSPWLILYDTAQEKEIRRRLLSESLLSELPQAFGPWPAGPPVAGVMDIGPQRGKLAVAFNVGSAPRICTIPENLVGSAKCRRAPRFVQDICWSPDGERLAVLYSNEFNTRNEYVWNARYRVPPLPPNVEIFDFASGRSVQFRTGSVAAKIEFSKDGREIYSIGVWAHIDQNDVIRVVSSQTGALVRTITVPRRGVRDIFTLSPRGQILAADASTNVPHSFLTEGRRGEKIARVVLLDSHTGELLFEHHDRTAGEISDPAQLLFSSGGRLLFVAPNSGSYAAPDTPDRVEMFSLIGLEGNK